MTLEERRPKGIRYAEMGVNTFFTFSNIGDRISKINDFFPL